MTDRIATEAALAAQGRMHRLIEDKFSVDTGCYVLGWDDDRVAQTTGLCPDLVRSYRKAAFGDLRAPPEIQTLNRDIATLQQQVDDATAEFRKQYEGLAARAAELSRKYQP